MKIGTYDVLGYEGFRERSARMEAAGYDTLVTEEAKCEPFVRAGVVAEHTKRAEIMTGIAVAFARNPLTLAHVAHDLNVQSQGRFHLGLGSQVKAHVTRRYSMPWSHPAPRMKDMILAIRAIWATWHDGAPLKYEGDFYQHTLMTPVFTPHEMQFGKPKIHLGAVGPFMTKVAAEVADGMITHSLTTPEYIRDVTLPMLEKGLAERGMTRSDFELSGVPFVATGETEEALAEAKSGIRKSLAFYCSTPSYKAVLDHHDLGELHDALHKMSRENRWDEMGDLIDDTTLNIFAVVGTGREVVQQVRARFGELYDRVSVRFDVEDTDELAELVGALKA